MPRALPSLLAFLICTPFSFAQAAPPRTTAEASGYAETSREGDVNRFIDACVKLSHGDRLTVKVAGKSHNGRALLLVRASLPAEPEEPRLRALVIGNIHAGEVEGKEAVQELLREFASGEHTELLERCDVWFVPIYNVDGNEAVAVGNRRGQNGPDAVGERPNAMGLDLNRDFVKADAPETRVLLGLFRQLDPHLFVDLHTTNGSHHGYHLTYSPSLSANLDHEIDAFGRALLVAASKTMRQAGFESFDYGNFETRDWEGSGAPGSEEGVRGWFTYDHRARYGVNYFGLRNRIGILSEAYSYADFETRIAATRAFVLALLENLIARRAELEAVTAAADQRLVTPTQPIWFGSQTTFGMPEQLPILVGQVERVEPDGKRPLRFVRKDETTSETLPVVRRFRALQQRQLPAAWAIPQPSPEVVQRLRWHGIEFEAVKAARQVSAQRFAVDKRRKPKRPYQGHQELVLEGRWLAAEQHDLALGTIVVRANQRLGRLAATLLEPESEDSLSSWNFFEAATDEFYPVLRLVE